MSGHGGGLRTIHVTIPYHKGSTRVEMVFEQLLDNIHNSIKHEKISFEFVSFRQHINVYVTFEPSLFDFMVGQLYALYPDAEIMEVKDYVNAEALAGKKYYGCELGLTRSKLYPTQSYLDFEKDPLSGVFSIMSKVQDYEQCWYQVIIEKIPDNFWLHFDHKWAHRFHHWTSFMRFRDNAKHGKGHDAHVKEKKWFDFKIGSKLFHVCIRLFVISNNVAEAKTKVLALSKGVFQLNNDDINCYKVKNEGDSSHLLHHYKERAPHPGLHLNTKEVASIFHIPDPSEIPNMVYVMSRKNEPPIDLPRPMPETRTSISYFGHTNYHNTNIPFGILRADRRRHLYIIGKSGSGKSKLLEMLIQDDIDHGHGLAVLDPHGDLVDNALRMVPEHRMDDVIIFDPSDTEFPIAFNLMENVGEKFKMQVTIGFIQIFKKLFGSNWSDRLEHVLRYTTLALLDSPNTTVFSILKMLTDKNYRQMIVRGIKDDVVKNFWVNEFAGWSEKFDSEAITPLLNKVGQFISTNMIRNIVAQSKNTFDIRRVMDDQKILLIKVSKGLLGEENAQLIGAMIITKLYQAAMARADMLEEERKDFYFYVDEFQNFATDTFAEILSEARKYRLNMTLAHQYMGQLPDVVRKTVFGNIGTFISFRIGAEDAAVMAQEFVPFFGVRDIINLGVQEFYTKMAVNGQTRDPFSGKTKNMKYPEVDHTQEIYALSRAKYCTPLNLIEEQLKKWDEAGSGAAADMKTADEEPEFEAPIV